MMGEHAGTVMEGTVREGIIRPIGTRGAVDIGPREEGEKALWSSHFTLLPSYIMFVTLGRNWLFLLSDQFFSFS